MANLQKNAADSATPSIQDRRERNVGAIMSEHSFMPSTLSFDLLNAFDISEGLLNFLACYYK